MSQIECEELFVLLWFQIIGKTIKTLGFHNNIHLLNLSGLNVSSRGVFRTHVTMHWYTCI